jgi:hypothetical protein
MRIRDNELLTALNLLSQSAEALRSPAQVISVSHANSAPFVQAVEQTWESITARSHVLGDDCEHVARAIAELIHQTKNLDAELAGRADRLISQAYSSNWRSARG